jgi:hypothetical protein
MGLGMGMGMGEGLGKEGRQEGGAPWGGERRWRRREEEGKSADRRMVWSLHEGYFATTTRKGVEPPRYEARANPLVVSLLLCSGRCRTRKLKRGTHRLHNKLSGPPRMDLPWPH